MAYSKQTWVDEVEGVQEGTAVDAIHMNHIENGIDYNSKVTEALKQIIKASVTIDGTSLIIQTDVDVAEGITIDDDDTYLVV